MKEGDLTLIAQVAPLTAGVRAAANDDVVPCRPSGDVAFLDCGCHVPREQVGSVGFGSWHVCFF